MRKNALRSPTEAPHLHVGPKAPSPVWSCNEWDPLEEVIVGRVDHACFPAWDVINRHTVPEGDWQRIARTVGRVGTYYPAAIVEPAQKALDGFIHILEAEGVTVRRPDRVDYGASFRTPDWEVSSGFCAANPRDPFLIVGDEIIEAPMADRSRYFEGRAYHRLFTEYFQRGARWSAAPRPRLDAPSYVPQYRRPRPAEPLTFVVANAEPLFDAADAVRCGRDVFVQPSHVTNALGIAWLARHLGSQFRVHTLASRNPEAIHIDTTFMPLAPGKVLVSPEYLDVNTLPRLFKTWDVLIAPEPVPTRHDPLRIISRWGCINVLMLDTERVIVEERQVPLIKTLTDWGFKPIPCAFEAYFPLMGSFHCATLDIRRRGKLESYF